MTDPIKIGFWTGGVSQGGGKLVAGVIDAFLDYPDPRTLVDPDWSDAERIVVAAYLDAGAIVKRYLGVSWCRFRCGEQDMGSADLSDGQYLWPEGLSHYVRLHRVRPPEDFIRRAIA